jgi:hypothetical protein
MYAWGRDPNTQGCAGYSTIYPTASAYGTWDGAVHLFSVYQGSSTGPWVGTIDSTTVLSVPASAICWTPQEASWFAESWDLGDSLGGSSSVKLHFFNMGYKDSAGVSWLSTNSNSSFACNNMIGGVTTPPFYCDITGATTVDVWSNR